jgi:hypothetical protein
MVQHSCLRCGSHWVEQGNYDFVVEHYTCKKCENNESLPSFEQIREKEKSENKARFREKQKRVYENGVIVRKQCTKCGQVKPVSAFCKVESGSTVGFLNWCRECANAHNQQRREKANIRA